MNRKLVAITGALLGACTPAQMDPASVDTYHYKVQFRPEELYPDYALDYGSCQGVAEAIIYGWMNNASKTD